MARTIERRHGVYDRLHYRFSRLEALDHVQQVSATTFQVEGPETKQEIDYIDSCSYSCSMDGTGSHVIASVVGGGAALH